MFASANDFGGRYDVRRVSADGKDVVTSAGMRVSVDLAVAEADQGCDVLVIPGGPEWDGLIKDEALLETIQRLHENARCTVSVCAGGFLLAAAGLLDGRRAATHWRFSRELKMRFPKVHVDPDAIFVRDGKMMTSAGVTAGIDLSLRRILDAVAEDPGATHTLETMARRVGVSTRHLSRLFYDELEITPARYVEQVRVEAARTTGIAAQVPTP